MLVPLLAPIVLSYGIDPLLFGFLFVMCGISKVSLNELIKSAWPFIVFQYVVLVACMLFPNIMTWLPRTLGYRDKPDNFVHTNQRACHETASHQSQYFPRRDSPDRE